jgi:hypothetical protein
MLVSGKHRKPTNYNINMNIQKKDYINLKKLISLYLR